MEEPSELRTIEAQTQDHSHSKGAGSDGGRIIRVTGRNESTSRETTDSLRYSSFGSKTSLYSTQNESDPRMSSHDTSELHGENVAPGSIVPDGCLRINEETIADEIHGDEGDGYGTLTVQSLKKIDTVSRQTSNSTSSLQNDLNKANSKSKFQAGDRTSTASFSKEDLAGFHNNERPGELSKNVSQKSNFSREDSGLSSIYMSEFSERSKSSMESGHNSALSGMTNMSPIVLKHQELVFEATQELHNEGSSCCSEASSIIPVEMTVNGSEKKCEIDEWKDYLKKMSTENQGSDSDIGTASECDTETCGSNIIDDVHDPDAVPGYFLYVTAEGHEIWILIDSERAQTEYNDDVVHDMLQESKLNTTGDGESAGNDGQYCPFHLSKADALTNVTKVTEFINKQKYENALLLQQEEQQRKLAAIRQLTTTVVTNEEGKEVEGMTVAERKKLLWNSSGKLESNRI